MTDYSAAIGLNAKDSDSYANRGSCYQHLGQNQLAIADFDRALRLNPDDDIAHLDRAAVLLRLHHDARALDDLNAAVRLRPNDGEVYATRAATYEALGNDAASIDDTTRALDLHADDADTLRFHRGLMEFHLRRLDEAQADFKQLVDEQPVSDLTGAAAAWLHASDHRLGLDDSSHLLVRASQLGSQWPAPLLRYLAGRVSREELLGAAHSGEQRCEAHMGIGVVEIAAHTGRDAQELAALRDCAPQPPDRRRPSGVPDEDGW
ncbi:MAG: tetratricopeptide repeat protein [Vulcanimicrobiaceae bacterium]